MNSNTFHLRDLDLNASNVISILNYFEIKSIHTITSISFSNNPKIGDIGAKEIAKHLPKSIRDIGLVNCGITDVGGKEILNAIKGLTRLQILCIEQNYFSDELKTRFQKLKNNFPSTIIVI